MVLGLPSVRPGEPGPSVTSEMQAWQPRNTSTRHAPPGPRLRQSADEVTDWAVYTARKADLGSCDHTLKALLRQHSCRSVTALLPVCHGCEDVLLPARSAPANSS